MREIPATISKKGQLTLPVEVQRLLGVGPRDRVVFAVNDDQVRLVPARYTLESVMGSVEPPTRTEEFERISAEAKEEHVAGSAAKLHRQP